MNDKLEKKFYDRFSFYRTDRSIQESLMRFGFECSDGWFQIIWDLSEKIEEVLKEEDNVVQQAKDELQDSGFEVIQVKEKFGTLRFYTNWSNPKIEAYIREAEEKSSVTCEICGKEATLRTDGWLTTLCDFCYNEKNGGGENGN